MTGGSIESAIRREFATILNKARNDDVLTEEQCLDLISRVNVHFGKKEKDPNAPKKPVTPYLAFAADCRKIAKGGPEKPSSAFPKQLNATAKKELDGKKGKDVQTAISELWKTCTAQKLETQYQAKFQLEKKAHAERLREYNDSKSAASLHEDDEEVAPAPVRKTAVPAKKAAPAAAAAPAKKAAPPAKKAPTPSPAADEEVVDDN